MKWIALTATALILSACAKPNVKEKLIVVDCPKPQVCMADFPEMEIKTNSDLAKAFLSALEERKQCQIALQKMVACYDSQADIVRQFKKTK